MFGFLFGLYLCNTYLFTICKCTETDDGLIKSFLKIPEYTSYSLGSNVTLSCKLKLIERTRIVVFRKDKSMKSEGCHAFNPEKYDIECLTVTENDIKYEVFKFTIKQLGWEDRGQWECFYTQNMKFINIEIKVNPVFDRLRVVPIPLVNEITQNVDSTRSQTYRLMGRGSRTNPYNLRDGTSINITCLSSCSYPEIIHKWVYQNSTHAWTELKSVRQFSRGICNSDSNKGMVASQSEVTIDCSSLKIVGANIVMCSSSTEADARNASVYILCPGGERPWELTTGEMAGVAVSVGLFVLLVTLIYLLMKKSRYSGVSGGDDSTKMYSSGMKL